MGLYVCDYYESKEAINELGDLEYLDKMLLTIFNSLYCY